MAKYNHEFKVGDKVSFTLARHRASKFSESIRYTTVRGTITEIDDKDLATIKLNRSKNTRRVHLGRLSLEGQPSELTQAFLNMARANKQQSTDGEKQEATDVLP